MAKEGQTKSSMANDKMAQEQPAALSSAKREAEEPPATGEEEDSEVKWAEMPVEHVMWILGQRRENHPTRCIEDFEQYRTKDDDPAEGTIFSRRDIDASREIFSRLFASLKESHDDFFEYQAWVRDVFERNGRVMVPEDVVGPRDEMQKEINEFWAQCKEEFAQEYPDSDAEEEDHEAWGHGNADRSAEEDIPAA
ncbi:hypothetical protein ACP70R_007433 [Stipagrostis hirtigluma subsp. patula]